MSFAPIHIEYALAFYALAEPRKGLGLERVNSYAGREVINWLSKKGLIDANENPTERLKVWVQHLCDQPLPVRKWSVPLPANKEG